MALVGSASSGFTYQGPMGTQDLWLPEQHGVHAILSGVYKTVEKGFTATNKQNNLCLVIELLKLGSTPDLQGIERFKLPMWLPCGSDVQLIAVRE